MYDREAFDVVATDIAQWQSDALHPAAARSISHDGHLAEKPDREPERLQRQLRLPPGRRRPVRTSSGTPSARSPGGPPPWRSSPWPPHSACTWRRIRTDTAVPGLGDGHPPARPARTIPYLAKSKGSFGMPNATSAMPARVVLDWRHASIGPLAPACCAATRDGVPVPGQGRALPQGLRRDLDHRPRPRRIRPRPADPRLHPRPG